MIGARCSVLVIGAWLGSMLLAPADASDDASYGFRILRAELRPDGTGKHYSLDADIDYRFSEPAIDALRNGVSLTIALQLTVTRDQDWWWKARVADEEHLFRIRYHAFSKLFQLADGSSETPRNFASINALMEAMGTIRGLAVMPIERLRKGERYRASLGVSLDIESLPLPLRPEAYINSAWYLHSPVYRWTFED